MLVKPQVEGECREKSKHHTSGSKLGLNCTKGNSDQVIGKNVVMAVGIKYWNNTW